MPNPESNISRWVTFLLGPLILLASAFIAVKAKSWFNYDLSPAAAAAYIVSIVGGIASLIWKWLHNRGAYELHKTTGLNEDQLNHILSTIEERIPVAPSAPISPAEGAPAASHAPPEVAASPPEPPVESHEPAAPWEEPTTEPPAATIDPVPISPPIDPPSSSPPPTQSA